MKAVQQPIAVLGAGSWGTALALYLTRRQQTVRLWSIETDHIRLMQKERVNQQYLPGYPFPDSLHPTPELQDAVNGIDDILVVVPSAGLRDTLTSLKPLLKPTARLICATKGLDLNTGQLLHDIARDILGDAIPLAVLSGPSFAGEVAAGLPTAVVIATQDSTFAQDLLARFNSSIFRIYLSTDVTGVEIGGVVKNVLAIATGISDGMGFGTNARAALLTRGLAEMMRLGEALGGRPETLTGLSGLGDLVLTCTDDQSRNRRFGLSLGKGQNIAETERTIGQVVEGKRNAELVVALAKKHRVEMPIAEMVLAILQGKITARDAMQTLLSREPRAEI
jgi:glycerol-3-phosphate dehydrogenase (NAD(P)+)